MMRMWFCYSQRNKQETEEEKQIINYSIEIIEGNETIFEGLQRRKDKMAIHNKYGICAVRSLCKVQKGKYFGKRIGKGKRYRIYNSN